MAFSSSWNRTQIRTYVRQEVLDIQGRWWTDARLNSAISDWYNELNGEFEPYWRTSTTTTTTSSIVLPADGIRFGRIYCNDIYLPRIDRIRLAEYSSLWRFAFKEFPICWYWDTVGTAMFWPTPYGTNTYINEYPTYNNVSDDSTLIPLPPWMKYSSIPFCAYKCYSMLGPNFDAQKAARYKAVFERQLKKIHTYRNNFFPGNYPSLKPGSLREWELTSLDGVEGINMAGIIINQSAMVQTTIVGTVDGVNYQFTLGTTGSDYMIFVGGLLMQNITDYTISGTSVSFVIPPSIGSVLQAWVAQ